MILITCTRVSSTILDLFRSSSRSFSVADNCGRLQTAILQVQMLNYLVFHLVQLQLKFAHSVFLAQLEIAQCALQLIAFRLSDMHQYALLRNARSTSP